MRPVKKLLVPVFQTSHNGWYTVSINGIFDLTQQLGLCWFPIKSQIHLIVCGQKAWNPSVCLFVENR